MTSFLTHPEFPTGNNIRHAFFTRNMKGSTHSYVYKDDSYNKDEIRKNHVIAMKELGVNPDQLRVLHQVHGTEAITVTDSFQAASPPLKADAMVCSTPGIALGILTADCVPLLFADPVHGVIGAAHAGWKGAKGGIIENTLKAMGECGASLTSTHALIGPCIHQASYEVGAEFKENFMADTAENNQFFIPSTRAGHYRFDLPGYVGHRLKMAGISQVSSLDRDTFTEESLFFSYRRCTLRGEAYRANILSVIAF